MTKEKITKEKMKIWVDADACPVVIKEILFRLAKRTGIELILIANQLISVPPAKNIKMLQVASGFDVADDEIVKRVNSKDLVITSDIPLADQVISKGAMAVSFRGELFTLENIKSILNMRDFMETMRSSGVHQGGPAPFNQTDRQTFANCLDKLVSQNYQPEK